MRGVGHFIFLNHIARIFSSTGFSGGNRKVKKLALLLSIIGLTCGCGGGGGGGNPPPPVISVSLSPAGSTTIDQGQTINFTASVANDSSSKGVTWSASGTGCTGDACGTFTSPAATTGTYNAPSAVSSNLTVSVKATSAADATKSASSTVVVTPPPSITTTSLPNGTVGTAYSATLQATGGAGTLTWTVVTGSLPAGLSLSSSGTISGTPTATGVLTFTVKVTDSSGGQAGPLSAQQQLSMTINNSPLTVTTTSLNYGYVGMSYSVSVAAAGGTSPYTWSITSGSLPGGLSLNASTGEISGTPTTAGASNFTVMVSDSSTPQQTQSRLLGIAINGGPTACGSGNEPVLNGQYAFSLSGFNGTGFLAVVGSFTADGTGKISAGEADSNGVLGVQHDSIDTNSSSYSVGSDNRGCATIVTSFGTFTTRFAVGSLSSGVATKGRIIEFDSPASGAYIAAGQIRKQDPTSFSGGLSGSYAFLEIGHEPSGRIGAVGVFRASSGTISNGEMDVNDIGSTMHLTGGTGSYTPSVDSNGSATGSMLWPSLPTSPFTFYMVSSSESLFLTTYDPATNPVMIGEMRKASGTFNNSSLNGVAVFALTGLTGSGTESEATFGTIAGNGSGSANITIYDDYGGSLTSDSGPCGYTVASNGRTTLPCGTGTPVLYLTGVNTALMLGTENSVQSGEAEPQAAGPLSNASVSGTFFLGTDAVVLQSALTDVGSITLDGSGGITEVTDFASTSNRIANTYGTLTYTVNPDGTFILGGFGTTAAGIVVSDSKFVMMGHLIGMPSILPAEK